MDNNENLLNTKELNNYNIFMKIWRIIYLPLIYFILPTGITFVAGIAYGIYSSVNGINSNVAR